MTICNSDYVVLKKGKVDYSIPYRRGMLYRVVSTSVVNGQSYALSVPVGMERECALRLGFTHMSTDSFERVYVRPAGVPENWEIVRVDMPAEWEYYQDPVDGLIYQSVTGAMPPYAAVNVVRSTGPQERGMPSHNKKYETVKQNNCQGVSPSKSIPLEISGKEDSMMDAVGTGVSMAVRKGGPVRTDESLLRKTGPYPVYVDEQNISDTYVDRRKQMGWLEAADSGLLESTAVEAEAWADLQEQYDVWVDAMKQDADWGGPEITLHQFLVSDDIDESSGCWRMVIATQEWIDTMQYKRCVKRATIGTYVVPKTS